MPTVQVGFETNTEQLDEAIEKVERLRDALQAAADAAERLREVFDGETTLLSSSIDMSELRKTVRDHRNLRT